MRVICKYSATEFKIPHFRGTVCEGIHPFFSLETETLLTFAKPWARGDLDAGESRVLFLALLASGQTEVEVFDERGKRSKTKVPLVVFRCPAFPSDEVVQKNMERVFKATLWISSTSSALLKLPRFVVTHDNKNLKNISSWLEAWEDEKKAFYDSHRASALAAKLSSLEEQLEKLIRSESRTTESFAGTLAKWALDASGFPKATALDLSTREIYTKIFRLKGFDIYSADKDDIADLVEWMEHNLPHGTIFANRTLKHLRKIRDANLGGLSKALGTTKEGKNFELLEDPIQQHNLELIAAKAPLVFPLPELYPSRVSYLRARAAWNTAETLKVEALKAAKDRASKAAELETLDFTTEEELEAVIRAEAQEELNFTSKNIDLSDIGANDE